MNLGYHQQLGKMNWGPPTIHACIYVLHMFHIFLWSHMEKEITSYIIYIQNMYYTSSDPIFTIYPEILTNSVYLSLPPSSAIEVLLRTGIHLGCCRTCISEGIICCLCRRQLFLQGTDRPGAWPWVFFLTDQNWKRMGITWNWILYGSDVRARVVWR